MKPVPEAYVEAAIAHLSKQVTAMIRLQQLTGMRPGEVTILRACDLDMGGKVWTYTPSTHKTEHHGIERPVYLGPRAQEVIKPFLKSDLKAFLFDPRDMMDDFQAIRRKNRKTPMTPSQQKRTKKSKRKVAPMDHYTTESYRRAITRACAKADKAARVQHPDAKPDDVFVPSWHPHQLRHNAATRLRRNSVLKPPGWCWATERPQSLKCMPKWIRRRQVALWGALDKMPRSTGDFIAVRPR